jgi:DNA polymerase I-like protein with 3'-5' exonuclease and polymerase domains
MSNLLVICPTALGMEANSILNSAVDYVESYAGKWTSVEVVVAKGSLIAMAKAAEADHVLLLGSRLANTLPMPSGTTLRGYQMYGILMGAKSRRWVATPHPEQYGTGETATVGGGNLIGHLVRHLELLKWGYAGWKDVGAPVRTRMVSDATSAKKFMREIEDAPVVAIDTETTDLRRIGNSLLTLQMGTNGDSCWVLPIGHPDSELEPRVLKHVRAWLKEYLERGNRATHIYANGAFDIHQFKSWLDLDWYNHLVWDLEYAEFSLDENREGRKQLGYVDRGAMWGLEKICQEYGLFHYSSSPVSKNDRARLSSLPLKDVATYGALDGALPIRVRAMEIELAKRRNAGMRDKPYTNFVENITLVEGVKVLQMCEMEHNGLYIDRKYVASLASPDSPFQKEVKAAEQRWNALPDVIEANTRLMKNSNVIGKTLFGDKKRTALQISKPAHQQMLFFEVAGLTPLKFGQNGASVDANFKKANRHAPIIIEFRDLEEAQKLYGTFIVGYNYVLCNNPDCKDGRLKTRFDGKATTSRLKCVAGWTPVTTKRGVIPIKDVLVGDMVWTHKKRWRSVTEVIRHGEYVVSKLELSNGHTLTCTPDHHLFSSESSWVESRNSYGFQQMGGQPSESEESLGVISGFGSKSDLRKYSQAAEHELCQHKSCSEQLHERIREEKSSPLSLPEQQNRQEESHEGFERDPTSKLEGVVCGQRWLLDHSSEREASISTSIPYGESSRFREITLVSARPPHRREYIEQQARQSSVGDPEGSQHDTCYANQSENSDRSESVQTEVYGEAKVQILSYREGFSTEIFDLTVEEDHSYESCGVFSHNSSDPNLQNVPSRSARAKMVKRQFVSVRGRLYRKRDFSAHEVRVLGITAKDPAMAERFWVGMQTRMRYAFEWEIAKEKEAWWAGELAGADVHNQNYGMMYEVDPRTVTKAQRSGVKTTIFATSYGKSLRTLASDLQRENEVRLEDLLDKSTKAGDRNSINNIEQEMEEARVRDWLQYATDLFDLIFRKKFRKAGEWLDYIQKEGAKTTHAKNIFGGVRHLYGYLHPARHVRAACNRRGPNSSIQGPSSNLGLLGAYHTRLLVWKWFVSRGVRIDNVQCNAVHDSTESETSIVQIPLMNYLEHHGFTTMNHRFIKRISGEAPNVGLESDVEVGPSLSNTKKADRWDKELDAIQKGIEWGNDNLGWNLPVEKLMRATRHNAIIIQKLRRQEIRKQLLDGERTNMWMAMNADNALKLGLIFEVDIGEDRKEVKKLERAKPTKDRVDWREEIAA